MPEAMATYPRAKEGWTVALEKPQAYPTTLPITPDITLSGRVLDLVVDVENKLFHTAIQAKSRVAVQGVDAADGSRWVMTLHGIGAHRVYWFTPRDAERLISEVLTETVDKLLAETIVEDQTLHLK